MPKPIDPYNYEGDDPDQDEPSKEDAEFWATWAKYLEDHADEITGEADK